MDGYLNALGDKIEKSFRQVRNIIDEIKKSNGNQIENLRSKAQNIFSDIEKNLQKFNKSLPEVNKDKDAYEEKYSNYQRTMKSLRVTLEKEIQKKTKKRETKKKKEEPKRFIDSDDDSDDDDRLTQKQKHQPRELIEILDVQNESIETVNRMKKTAIKTNEVADEIMVKLKEQTEQMERIQKKLDNLGSGINRAQRELKTFMRNLACDYWIMACVALIVVVIIAFIVMRIFLPKDAFSKNPFIPYYPDSGSGSGSA